MDFTKSLNFPPQYFIQKTDKGKWFHNYPSQPTNDLVIVYVAVFKALLFSLTSIVRQLLKGKQGFPFHSVVCRTWPQPFIVNEGGQCALHAYIMGKNTVAIHWQMYSTLWAIRAIHVQLLNNVWWHHFHLKDLHSTDSFLFAFPFITLQDQYENVLFIHCVALCCSVHQDFKDTLMKLGYLLIFFGPEP